MAIKIRKQFKGCLVIVKQNPSLRPGCSAAVMQPPKKLDLFYGLTVFLQRIDRIEGCTVGGICRVPQGVLDCSGASIGYCPADCDLMYTIGYFVIALAKVLDLVLSIYFWIIIARAVLSWVNPDPYNPIVRFIHSITEPVLVKVRSRLPLFFGGFDFTPILILAAIMFLNEFLVNSLYQFGRSLL